MTEKVRQVAKEFPAVAFKLGFIQNDSHADASPPVARDNKEGATEEVVVGGGHQLERGAPHMELLVTEGNGEEEREKEGRTENEEGEEEGGIKVEEEEERETEHERRGEEGERREEGDEMERMEEDGAIVDELINQPMELANNNRGIVHSQLEIYHKLGIFDILGGNSYAIAV